MFWHIWVSFVIYFCFCKSMRWPDRQRPHVLVMQCDSTREGEPFSFVKKKKKSDLCAETVLCREKGSAPPRYRSHDSCPRPLTSSSTTWLLGPQGIAVRAAGPVFWDVSVDQMNWWWKNFGELTSTYWVVLVKWKHFQEASNPLLPYFMSLILQ